jgi:cbb3-type cytochrome oxidase cytochrome c subunit
MNRGPLIFLAAFFALATSWSGYVLAPQLQIGRLQQTNSVPAGATYPLGRPGLARQGLEIYRANGCAYCHSQQVTQSGTTCDVMLTDAGTNPPALLSALQTLTASNADLVAVRQDSAVSQNSVLRASNQPPSSATTAGPSNTLSVIANLPRTILHGLSRSAADVAVKSLTATGAKASVWIAPEGPDLARGWGQRRSVAEDYLFDNPVMLGSQRIGPDLANIGVRRPNAQWHLLHLYLPASEVKGSTMPPYRFLFAKQKIQRQRSPDALALPPERAIDPGYEVVPTPEAHALVAYLLSLRADAPLFVAPLSVASSASSGSAATNASPAATAAPTNAAPAAAPAP